MRRLVAALVLAGAGLAGAGDAARLQDATTIHLEGKARTTIKDAREVAVIVSALEDATARAPEGDLGFHGQATVSFTSSRAVTAATLRVAKKKLVLAFGDRTIALSARAAALILPLVAPSRDFEAGPRCPRCECGAFTVRIRYGKPGREAMDAFDRGEIHLAGCQPSDERWHCKACGDEW